jgi:hypothetical protein
LVVVEPSLPTCSAATFTGILAITATAITPQFFLFGFCSIYEHAIYILNRIYVLDDRTRRIENLHDD